MRPTRAARLLPILLPCAAGGALAAGAAAAGEGVAGTSLQAAALAAAALGLGLWLLEAGPELSPLERIACAAGLGHALLALLFLGLGGMGLLRRGPLVVLLAVACAASGPPLWAWLRELARGRRATAVPLSAALAALLLAAAATLGGLASLRPPVSEEALTSTAAIPEQWALTGSASPFPGLFPSYAPPAAALHRAAALALGGERLAGAWGAAAGALLLLGASLLARWLTSGGWATSLLAASLAGSVPLLPLAAAAPGGAVPAAGLALLSLWALLRGAEEEDRRWAALSGALLGCGLLSSHGAWAAVPALAALAFGHRGIGESRRVAAARLALALAVALLPPLPLYIRNTLATGNPVYPHVWGGRNWDEASSEALSEQVLEPPPARVLWLGARGQEDVLGPGAPVILAAAVGGPLLGERALALAVGSGILGIGWAVSGASLAWTLPSLAGAGALAAAAAARLRRRRPALGKALLAVLVLAMAGGVGSLAWSLGLPSRKLLLRGEERLAERFPRVRDYEVLRSVLPEGAKVLLVGETRPFRLGRRAVWGTPIDVAPVTRLAREALATDPDDPAAAFRRLLAREGITHVLLDETRCRELDRERDHFRELRGGRWGTILLWLGRPALVWSDARGSLLLDARAGSSVPEPSEEPPP